MGSKGFWSFLNSIVKRVELSKLKGKPLLIDINLYLYKHIIGIKKNGTDIINKKGENINHILSIYNIIKNFIIAGIYPICVFDGKAPFIKNNVVEKRRTNSQKSNILISNISDSNSEYIKHFKRSFVINKEIIDECKIFLKMCGIPYIESAGEADEQCAALSYYCKDLISGILSEDSDIFMFGGTILYKDIDLYENTISELSIKDILEYLQNKADDIYIKNNLSKEIFTFNNMLDFSIILGNDYTNGIRYNIKKDNKEFINNDTSFQNISREEIFNQFILCDKDIDKLITKLYNYNEIKGVIIYYIPAQFKQVYEETIYNYKNPFVLQPEDIDINMKKIDTNKLTSYLAQREVNTNMLFRTNLKRMYEKFNVINISSFKSNKISEI